MGRDYDEHMEIIEEEIRDYGYAGSFREAMDMGGSPMITAPQGVGSEVVFGMQRQHPVRVLES